MMDVRNEDRNDLRTLLSDPPKVLQVVAIAALIMGLGAAVAYYAEYVFTSDRSEGWGIASMTFYLVNSAVYAPAVLLGFMALLLVRSDERRDQAIKMTRLIMIAVVLLVLSGLGQAICLVGDSLSTNWVGGSPWWNVATQAFSFMASVLFESGVLLGLVYIFRQQERKYAARRLSGCDLPEAEERRPDGIRS
jgi:cell division protein FtsW (lipid II flippase)